MERSVFYISIDYKTIKGSPETEIQVLRRPPLFFGESFSVRELT